MPNTPATCVSPDQNGAHPRDAASKVHQLHQFGTIAAVSGNRKGGVRRRRRSGWRPIGFRAEGAMITASDWKPIDPRATPSWRT